MKKIFLIISMILLIFTGNLFAASIGAPDTIYGALNKPHNSNMALIWSYLQLLDQNGDGVIETYGYDTIPISTMKDGLTAPATLDDASTRSPYAYRDFDDVRNEDLDVTWLVPPDMTGTTVNYRVYYLLTAAVGPVSGNGVAFAAMGASMGNGDMSNAAADGSAYSYDNYAADGSQYNIRITAWSGNLTISNVAPGEVAELKLAREPTNTIDDYGQDVGPFKMQIRYTKKATK